MNSYGNSKKYIKNNNSINKSKKKWSIDKLNKNNNNDNFWEDINDDDYNILSLEKNDFIIDDSFIKEKEKENNTQYKYKNIIKVNDGYNNININNTFKIKKNKKNNSVDNKDIKNKKIDNLSVFRRNQKWLENKKEKLNKELEKYKNKKEKEINEKTLQYKMNKKKDIIYKEEDNVTLKPENYRFFMRLIHGRQEKERSLDHNYKYVKVNVLKNSHYSGKKNGNISQKQMNKYKKYIHNELKGENNKN